MESEHEPIDAVARFFARRVEAQRQRNARKLECQHPTYDHSRPSDIEPLDFDDIA